MGVYRHEAVIGIRNIHLWQLFPLHRRIMWISLLKSEGECKKLVSALNPSDVCPRQHQTSRLQHMTVLSLFGAGREGPGDYRGLSRHLIYGRHSLKGKAGWGAHRWLEHLIQVHISWGIQCGKLRTPVVPLAGGSGIHPGTWSVRCSLSFLIAPQDLRSHCVL